MNRSDLIEHIRPKVEQLAIDLVDTVWNRFEQQIDDALEVARSALASDLEGAVEKTEAATLADDGPGTPCTPGTRDVGTVAPVELARIVGSEAERHRRRPPRKLAEPQAPQARSSRASSGAKPQVVSADGIKKRGPYTCRLCGAIGFRSDGCGRTHNVKPATDAAPASDDEDHGAEPARSRTPRPSTATTQGPELPVIPHLTLVAMLAADRANNAVGDAGGYIARADREPSLVGPTSNRREVCSVHGWVGAHRFDVDRHDTCAPVIEADQECRRCKGTGRGIAKFCTWCGGSGIDHPPAKDIEEPDLEESTDHAELGEVVSAEAPTDTIVNGKRVRGHRTAPRAKTIAVKRITRAELRIGALLYPDVGIERPRTRGECGTERPCPFVGCSKHLYLDINPETGSIKINFPDVEPENMRFSCSLDEAEKGPHTLEAVGEKMNVTRERLRQIEMQALVLLKPLVEAEGPELR